MNHVSMHLSTESPMAINDNPPLLSVENLTTYFPITSGLFNRRIADVHAVESVSFEIEPGETFAIVGESGCGKTTTGRTIIGLEKPTQGDIKFKGESVSSFDASQRRSFHRKVQMIFQDPYSSLNPRLTLASTLGEPMRVHKLVPPKEIPDRVCELLEQVNLSADFGHRYPHELSGGQRQRISIARALALNPEVIICDEAVSALDVTIKAQIINLLMDLQDELHLSYLFISHDMAVVERMSHRVAVMYLGQIVELGPRESVFENPTHPYTQRLLSAVPIADPHLRRTKRNRSTAEVPSVVRSTTFKPSLVEYREVSDGHLVALEDS